MPDADVDALVSSKESLVQQNAAIRELVSPRQPHGRQHCQAMRFGAENFSHSAVA